MARRIRLGKRRPRSPYEDSNNPLDDLRGWMGRHTHTRPRSPRGTRSSHWPPVEPDMAENEHRRLRFSLAQRYSSEPQ